MYLDEHFQAYMNMPILNIGITLFYALVVVAMLQAVKWHVGAIFVAAVFSCALFLVSVFTDTKQIIGNTGSIALPQEAQDFMIVAIGAILGTLISVLICSIRKAREK